MGGGSILLQIEKNKSLIFSSSEEKISIEKSIFLGRNKILNNFCITIHGKTNNEDNTEENKIKISLTLNKIIEGMISKDPGQWILTHNRWK